MKIQITTAVMTGILSFISGSPAVAANVANTSASGAISTVNSRDLIIEGEAETAPVQIHFTGAERVELGRPGELFVMRHGVRQHYRPQAYQIVNGKWRPLSVGYSVNGCDTATLTFGRFDASAPIYVRYGAATA
jgi:hypothetical protein